MTVGKRGILNKTFSLLRGAILGRLKIYRAGHGRDLCLSFELEFQRP